MSYLGEILSLVVAVSWTATALFAEVGSKRLGSLQLNVIRMVLSLTLLSITLWIFTGAPYPQYANGKAWFWLLMSGFVGYVLGDYCLFNSYVIIGSRFGQLFMTLAPAAAAISGWIILGEQLHFKAIIGMAVTQTGIALSVLSRVSDGDKEHSSHKLTLKLPLKGVLFGIGAGLGQGIGIVLSKVGMNYYESSIPAGEETVVQMLPFASTLIRAIIGTLGFICLMGIQRKFGTLKSAFKDKKGMRAAVLATITGPFIGVSLSLMAVQNTEAGIASTIMALTPVFIIWPSYLFFKQRITLREVIGAVISVVGVSLFFL